MKEFINASELKDMILCADAALHANMQVINELNVFPVPDGDTGTNMSLTVNNAALELRKKDFQLLDEENGNAPKALDRLFEALKQ